MATIPSPNDESAAAPRVGRRRMVFLNVVQLAMQVILFSILLIFISGRWNWLEGWITLIVYLGGLFAMNLWLAIRNPSLAEERAFATKKADRGDYVLVQTANLLLIVVALPVAALDRRFGWSPRLPAALPIAAWACIAAGFAAIAWGMASNPFFSALVRIQTDRGHKLAEGGPYRFLRHPGYTAMIAQFLLIPIGLGSLWALIPAGLTAILYGVRTAREDRILHEQLAGYAEYARRVRFRLIPGIW